jgi:serine/threonine-protein kinase
MTPERWEEIERLFQTALDLQPSRRQEYLDENCHGDESLRKEVESLLETTVAEAFLNDPAMELAAKSLAREKDRTTARNLIGSSLSHYRIIDRIGEGASAGARTARARNGRCDGGGEIRLGDTARVHARVGESSPLRRRGRI